MQLRTAALTKAKAKKQLCTCAIAAWLPVKNWRDGSKEGWSWMTFGDVGFRRCLIVVLLVKGWKSVVIEPADMTIKIR